jgi:hypothetical protein
MMDAEPNTPQSKAPDVVFIVGGGVYEHQERYWVIADDLDGTCISIDNGTDITCFAASKAIVIPVRFATIGGGRGETVRFPDSSSETEG